MSASKVLPLGELYDSSSRGLQSDPNVAWKASEAQTDLFSLFQRTVATGGAEVRFALAVDTRRIRHAVLGRGVTVV